MDKIIENNLNEIVRLFTFYGANSAYVFGSAAINTMKHDSDIDFLFSFSNEIDFEAYTNNYFNLVFSLEDLLKKEVDLVAIKTLQNPYLIEKINSQKVKLI